MQEDKGLQELAQKLLTEKRFSRTITRGEPRSFVFSTSFLQAFKKEFYSLKTRNIANDKILRGLEYQILLLDNEPKEEPVNVNARNEVHQLPPDEAKILQKRPTLKF